MTTSSDQNASGTLCVRKACLDDAEVLFSWLNTDNSLDGKLETTGPVLWSDHLDWFRNRMQRTDCFIYIIELDAVPRGQIRFESKSGDLEIDIFLAAGSRRSGAAKVALEQALGFLGMDTNAQTVIARVLKTNEISASFFIKCGFTEVQAYPGTRVFSFDLPPKETC